MDLINSFAIITLTAVVHACFQLSISVLTLMSGHALGNGKSKNKILRMSGSFVAGAKVMTILLLSFTCLVIAKLFTNESPLVFWAISCGLSVSAALSVWIFYYRKGDGTSLWIPRNMAKYLTKRARSTGMSGEAFGLGLSSVFSELLFIFTPLFISALTILQLPNSLWQVIGILVYSLISTLPLTIVWILVNGGFSLGLIQKWRESNKHFLQTISGIGLIVVAFFVAVNEILVNITGGGM